MQTRKANNEPDYCKGCHLYNVCKLRKLEFSKKINLCLTPEPMVRNYQKEKDQDLKAKKNDAVNDFIQRSMDLAREILQQSYNPEPPKTSPVDRKPYPVTLNCTYSYMLEKAFDISTNNEDVVLYQKALIAARNWANRPLKRKVPKPLEEIMFFLSYVNGQITESGHYQ